MTCPTKIELLADQILQNISGLCAWRRRFLVRLFVLWPALLGRHNFINLGRQGEYGEYTYRKHYAKSFKWLEFNSQLVRAHLGKNCIIAIDPTYIPKSGKKTAGVGYYHSGCAGRSLWGLEMTGLAAVDLDSKIALHLDGVQTVEKSEDEPLLQYYGEILSCRAEKLQSISKTVVADAYFSRKPFIAEVMKAGFTLVSRLRSDVHLRYYYQGEQKPKGRPRKYAGKVNLKDPELSVFSLVNSLSSSDTRVYEGGVELKAAAIPIKAVLIQKLDAEGVVKSVKVYMSTDTAMSADFIIHAYRCRYQQEFLFRDAKQYSGLSEGQARDWKKIDFHFNTAMTVVNLAKVAHHLSIPERQREAFSMADVCTAYANERLALRIFEGCGIDPHLPKMQALLGSIRNYAARAA